MKLPTEIVDSSLVIGEERFAIFHSFVLVPAEKSDTPVGVLFRAGEVSIISTNDDPAEDANPFNLSTAHMVVEHLEGESPEAAVAKFKEALDNVVGHIQKYQASKLAAAAGEAEAGAYCCGGEDCCQDEAVDQEAKPAEEAAPDEKA